jgi:hypothetical protein
MLTSKEQAIGSIEDLIKGECPDTACSSVFKDEKVGTSGFPQSLLTTYIEKALLYLTAESWDGQIAVSCIQTGGL